MSYSNISASLSPDDKQTVLQAAQTIKGKLPFLINLNEEDKKRLRKMGNIRASYVQEVYNASVTNRDSIPSGFSLDEFEKDVTLHEILVEILTVLMPVCEGLKDTEMALGGELMKQSDECYGYLKVGAKKSSSKNLNDIVKNIAGHLKQGPRKTKGNNPAAAK